MNATKKFLVLLFITIWLAFNSTVPAYAGDIGIMSTSIPRGQYLTGDFTQVRMVPGRNFKLRTSGTFLVWPDHGLVWHVSEPFLSTIVITENTAVQAGADQNFSPIAGMSDHSGTMLEVLNLILAGNLQALKSASYFDPLETTEMPDGRVVVRVSLLDNQSEQTYFEVTISPTVGGHVSEAKIFQGAGSPEPVQATKFSNHNTRPLPVPAQWQRVFESSL